MMAAKLNITGQRYGKLLVLHPKPSIGRQTRWECMCDCGALVETDTRSLRFSGKTSCGCDTFEKRSVKLRTHGLSKTGTYKSWMMMKSRCLNPNYDFYCYYGGRGIGICKEWVESFETFLDDMGERPAGMTLDRIDSDGDYRKGNCKWSTREEQVDNRRNGVLYTHAGVTLSPKEWGVILGVKRSQLYLAAYHGATLEGFIMKRGLSHKLDEYKEHWNGINTITQRVFIATAKTTPAAARLVGLQV